MPSDIGGAASDADAEIGRRLTSTFQGDDMSNSSAQHPTAPAAPQTVADIVAAVAPMENLDQFLIDDLTAEEQDEFYRVLEQA